MPRENIYKGRIVDLYLEDERYEIVEHADAVAILVQKEDKVLFVRQYRRAVGVATLEIPAGLIEPGETPEQAALRELAEEAQLTGELELLAQFYVSPGFCNEKLYIFRATQTQPAYAKPDDDEDITVEWHDPRQVLLDNQAGQTPLSASAMAGILFSMTLSTTL
jgi:ADP-ribose pyrophosphatase